MKLLIGGVDRTSYLQTETLTIADRLNENSTSQFTLRSSDYHPQVGEAVEVYDDENTLIFAGSIDEPEEEYYYSAGYLFVTVQAVDNHYLANRHLVGETYDEDTKAGVIIKDIITKYLAQEGITEGNIQDGPETDGLVVFPYVYADEAIEEISAITGFQWVIRPDKSLDFFSRETFVAPFDIGREAPILAHPKVTKSREEYRNVQWTRAGQDISIERTLEFAGDSKRTVWAVDLPIAKVPTIQVNGVAKDVGIRGLDNDKQFYWQKGQKEITQDDSEAVLISTDTLTIKFQGFYPILVLADDSTAVAERQGVEGGSGKYEHIENKPEIENRNSALEFSQAKLRKYARINATIEYQTREKSLRPGMIQHIDLPEYELNGTFLISEVEITDTGKELRYTVTAVDGESVGGWIKFFKDMKKAERTFTIRENEILVRLFNFRSRINLLDDADVDEGEQFESAIDLLDDAETTLHDYLKAKPALKAGVFRI